MNKKKKKSSNGKRAALTVLCVVLGVLLVVMLGGTVYAEYLLGKLNYVDTDATLPSLSEEELRALENETEELDPDFNGIEMDESDIVFGEAGVSIGGKDDNNIVNILLIGQDTRTGVRSRSDSMILCTFNKSRNTLTMTSFMRDLYVAIPGYSNTRINAAYAYGGMPLLDETLEKNFGIHVDGNVEVDFTQFREIVDLLGGVDLELTSGEAWYINRYTTEGGGSAMIEGWNHLNGAQALTHARNRNNIDGDFSRTNRQRVLLSALVEKYKNSKLTDMISLLEKILPMVTTDMSKKEIVSYATELFPMLSSCKIVTQHIPVDDGYTNAVIGGAQVLVPDMTKNVQALVDSLVE